MTAPAGIVAERSTDLRLADVPPGCPLSRHEFRCAQLRAHGLSTGEIGERIGRARSTVGSHLANAAGKLNVRGMAQLVAVMNAAGWLDHIDTDWEDERLTASQSLYVDAFERWLRDPSEQATEERMHWLRGIYYEAKILPPWEQLGIPQPARG